MKRIFATLLVLCLLLASCSSPEASVTDDSRYDRINEAMDFHANHSDSEVVSGFSEEEIAEATDGLLSTGAIDEEFLATLSMDSPTSRALFIRLIVSALGGENSRPDNVTPSETWYAPYVQEAYDMGLFPDGGTTLSFLPADGFCLGDDGYAPMLEDMTRDDAGRIFEYLFPGEDLLPTLEKEEFFGYEENRISQSAALVCAWRAHDLGYTPKPSDSVPSPEEILADSRTIIHAGGYITDTQGKQYSYTNSAEALTNAYFSGARMIEIDFSETSDGHLACVHEWTEELSPDVVEGETLSLEEWLDTEIYQSFSPMCLESLASFMRQHKDLYIVTDVKSSNVHAAEMIANTCPDLLDRFIIQIYSDGQYDPIAELGFSRIIFTLYNFGEKRMNTDFLVEFASTHTLFAYTYGNTLLDEEGYTEAMLKSGVPLCTHTINDAAAIQRAYDMGITAVYTDNVG